MSTRLLTICLIIICNDTITGFSNPQNSLASADGLFDELLFDRAETAYKQILLHDDPDINDTIRVAINNHLVTCLWRQEKYPEAEKTARENLAYTVEHLGTSHPGTGQAFLQLGILSFLSSHTGITDAYFTKAIDVFDKNYGIVNPNSAKAYEWLGIYHNGFSDSVNARKYLWKALNIYKKLQIDSTFQCADLYRYIGLFYKRYGYFDSCMIYFHTAKSLFDEKYTPYNFKSIKCLNNMADVHEWFNRFDSAVAVHYRCLDLYRNCEAKNRYTLMMTYYNMAELYRKYNYYDSSLKYIQKVLKLYFPGLDENNLLVNPEQADSLPYSIPKIALLFKANTLQKIYESDTLENLDYLLSSAHCYRLAHRILQSMKRSIHSIDELIFLEHMHANRYLVMADNALQVYNKLNDTSYLSDALNYLSINRSANLIFNDEMHRKVYNKYFSTYYEEETELEKRLNELLSKRQSIDESDVTHPLNIQIADTKTRMDDFSWKLSRQNPGIVDSVGILKRIFLSDIRNRLKKGQVLIWFHEHCSDYKEDPFEIVTVAISKNDLRFLKTDGKSTIRLIKRYHSLVSDRSSALSGVDSAGYALFNRLIEPFINKNKYKDLIIIPSQHISLVPFDALPVNQKDAENGKGRMIYQFTVRYEFSIHSFLNKITCPIDENKILALVPEFNDRQKEAIAMLTNRDTSLLNLPGAKLECEKISILFPTKILEGKEATRRSFEKYCPDYPILHLSTHGLPDKNHASAIRLAFSDYEQRGQRGSMDMYEVMNLDLHTSLVVLSACKTGMGEMSKGEGNINLAWAFRHAGAQSVLVSLWDANDYASSVIMPKFYEYLATGFSKPEALRQAKLDFIQSSDEVTSSPYFWSGFVYWGDGGKVLKGKTDSKIDYRLVFAISIFVLLLYYLTKLLFVKRFQY